jgi:hypothetical protein
MQDENLDFVEIETIIKMQDGMCQRKKTKEETQIFFSTYDEFSFLLWLYFACVYLRSTKVLSHFKIAKLQKVHLKR